MDKDKEYRDLVEAVKKKYSQDILGGYYGAKKTEPFYLKWCDECDEINLWTYWQGRDVKRVDILVVGQDWGNPFHEKTYTKKIMDNIIKINNGDISSNCLYGIESLSAADRYLRVLFQELMLGNKQIYPDIALHKYDNLFFTNFCLGYRTGKESGGLTKDIMLKDAEFFKRLVDILMPKIIVCLGKDTYECVVESLVGEKMDMASMEYWNLLNRRRTHKKTDSGIVIYGMGHCGAFGVNINRKKYDRDSDKFTKFKSFSGLELMKYDWRAINDSIEEFQISPNVIE